jgi:hypothetical protein
MEPPRLQFTTSSLLLTVTFVSLCFGGIVAWSKIIGVPFDEMPEHYAIQVAFWSPNWLPCVFLVYAFGRRTITARMVLLFSLGETIAMVALLCMQIIYWP